ncbi:hypothetical protein FQZ97_1238550 [compost metagenome]
MQHIFGRGTGGDGNPHVVQRLALALQHHHALAGQGADHAEGFQHGDGLAQARPADFQLLGQFALPRQHLPGRPQALLDGFEQFLHDGIDPFG